jgi:hypothetical protein
VYVPLPVLPAVVLMDTTGTNQAEVSPCNEIASLVVELRLRDRGCRVTSRPARCGCEALRGTETKTVSVELEASGSPL